VKNKNKLQKINRNSFTEKLILMKISETTTIGFSSAGHTLCHLLTLLFPTALLAVENTLLVRYAPSHRQGLFSV
jgi:hypothetical protein